MIVCAGIVWPAEGEALTTVPGFKAGEGQGLLERKSGWMLLSRKGLYSQVALGFDVGESREMDDGDGKGGYMVLSREIGVGVLRRKLDMLRMLWLPQKGFVGVCLSVREGEGLERVEVVSMEAFLASWDGQSVVSE